MIKEKSELESLKSSIFKLKAKFDETTLRYRFSLNSLNLINVKIFKASILIISISLIPSFINGTLYILNININIEYKIFILTLGISIVGFIIKQIFKLYKSYHILEKKIEEENVIIIRKLEEDFNIKL